MHCRLGTGAFFGRVAAPLAAGPFRLTETRYAPGDRLPRHGHDGPFLCVVLGGGYEESSRSVTATCPAGAVAVHFDDILHADQFGPRGGH